MNRWPHQEKGVLDVLSAIDQGKRRICLTSPTGGGKTTISQDLIQNYLDRGLSVSLYTNRRMMLEQLSDRMEIGHGIRAAGYDDERERQFQISSMQTEASRVLRKKRWKIHNAKLVIIDEAHLHKEDTAKGIFQAHQEAVPDCAFVGMTATPIDLAEMYDHLIVAGKTSELRECGALVPARCFAAEEPDVEEWKRLQTEDDIPDRVVETIMMQNQSFLIGRIFHWFDIVNPDKRPTICFGPSVAGSAWIAEQFQRRGITACHIDGQNVWLNGEWYDNEENIREDILGKSKDGKLSVICNRFVLREGIDCPWLAHAIFATIFGSLQSYLQSGGRLLRAHDGIQYVTIQDHGGNWTRFYPLNIDRHWQLDRTSNQYAALRGDQLRKSAPETQPFRCPNCARVWAKGRVCLVEHGGCGHEIPRGVSPRPVFTRAGEIREVTRPLAKPRKPYLRFDGKEKWEQMYWRARSKKWNATFTQAEALFAHENYGWPDRDWPFMPRDKGDVFRKVRDVSADKLIPKV